jgi:hypothetical protein
MAPAPAGMLFGSSAKASGAGVDTNKTLGVNFLAMSDGSGAGSNVGVCKGELVKGVAEGLHPRSPAIIVISERVKNNCLNIEDGLLWNIGCRFIVTSLSTSAN